MSDPRQQLIDLIDALTPEEQKRALVLLRSLSSGEAASDVNATSGRGDGAMNQSRTSESSAARGEDAEPSQEEIDRKMAALDTFIGGVSHGSLAKDIDEELYGR